MIVPHEMLKPRRPIEGISAILLPFQDDGSIDWVGFRAHVRRTAAAKLIPAVNMDTGFGNLLDDRTKREVLEVTQSELGGSRFVAGAFENDQPCAGFEIDKYAIQMAAIEACGGTPVIFPSYGLTQQPDDAIVAAYAQIGERTNGFIGFELGTMFAPFGKIYSLDVYRGLLDIPRCLGAKHSSLRRDLEWQRLQLRDAVRADFRVYTGNDLAIDMVMYGSDYLLGLSTFAPEMFAERDAMWATADSRFYEVNDLLQYLGFFAFRNPVPAYKHSAAMFLKLRGWIGCDRTHSQSATRPDSDRLILRDIAERMGV